MDAVHRYGKEIYVWTVNSPSVVKSLANMGVDNIITDDPVMAREAVYSRYTGKELVNILDYVFSMNGYVSAGASSTITSLINVLLSAVVFRSIRATPRFIPTLIS